MPFSAGDNLGPYQLLAPVGEGAMGEVWKAQDTRLGRTVAIKILRAAHGERFQREARAIAALNHPHVCTLHDIGPNYLVMEYIEGKPLRGPLEPERARQFALEIAQALAAAHARGIIHRDLKPANVLVTESGVKLLDFGLARLLQENLRDDDTVTQTRAGVIVGTAAYMSPEQAEGKPADARSDVFSFGLVLYEMLSGRRPFTGATLIGVAAAILHKPHEPLGAPVELGVIVDRCLRKDPAERYQSMAEVAAALAAVRLRPDNRVGSSAARSRVRFRRYAAASLAILALLTAGAVYRWTSHAQTVDSVAVLPFANSGGNSETDYLSDGITEAVINSLAAASRLKVIARTTVFMLKDQALEPQKTGRKLGVGAVLIGKVSRRGDSINIQTDLVKVADGSELWGASFRQNLADMQNLQGEIAREIAEKLRLRLEGDERRRLTRRFTDNGEAFQLYLKARHTSGLRLAGYNERLDLLGQAVAKDPGFARAYVAMADTYFRLGETRQWPADKAVRMQKDAVQKALALDDSLGEAHLQLARSSLLDFDLAAADREFQRALELNTNGAHTPYGKFLAQTGRKQEAVAEAQRGLEVDPLDRVTQNDVIWIHWLVGMNEQAVEEHRKYFGESPYCFICADILVQRGQYREAIAEWEKMPGDNAGMIGHRAQAYIKAGRIAEGRRTLEDLETRARREKIGAYEAAFVHAALGETDEAFRWLDTAYEQRDPGLLYLKTDHLLDPLRSDPRFPRLLRRVGLPL